MTTASGPDRRVRRSRRVAQVLVALLVLVLIGAGGAALVLGGPAAGPPAPAPDPLREPAAVEPPEGLRLPEVPEAPPVAPGLPAATRVDPAAVRRALGRLVEDRRLGRRVAVAVAGLDGDPVHESGPRAVTPASTMKLLTGLAALEALGP